MSDRSTSKVALALLLGLTLLPLTGCGTKTPETDTAEVIPSKPPVEPTAPAPTPEATKDAPKE